MERGVPATDPAHHLGHQDQIGDLLIRPVQCQHWAGTRLKDGSRVPGFPVSFIVETEPGVRVYHSGDTAVFGDMAFIGELHRPTVGLIGAARRTTSCRASTRARARW